MTYGGEVDPDLMGASGLEPAVEQTRNRRGGTAALRTCRMHVMPPPDPPAPHPTLPRKQGRVSRYTLPCLRGRVGWGQREGDRRIVFQYLPQRYGLATPGPHRHPLTGLGVAIDRLVDQALGPVRRPP